VKTHEISEPPQHYQRRSHEWLLTLPSFGWLSFFFIIPACIVCTLAFLSSDATGTVLPEWSLHSLRAIDDTRVLEVAWRTVWLSVATMVICVTIALPVSYYMASVPRRHQQALFLLVVIPMWSCFLVRIFAWKVVLHPEGIVKGLLVACGMIHPSTSLLYNNVTVLIVMVYSYLPFAILPLYSAASKFQFQLFEAAMDLGASKRQAFISVFIPSMRSALFTASLMVFIPAAGAYIIPEVVGGKSSEMLGNVIARRVLIDRSLPDASGLALLLFGIIVIPAIVIGTLKASSSAQRVRR
jgi:spermidine/putrescine transport system permease protein